MSNKNFDKDYFAGELIQFQNSPGLMTFTQINTLRNQLIQIEPMMKSLTMSKFGINSNSKFTDSHKIGDYNVLLGLIKKCDWYLENKFKNEQR